MFTPRDEIHHSKALAPNTFTHTTACTFTKTCTAVPSIINHQSSLSKSFKGHEFLYREAFNTQLIDIKERLMRMLRNVAPTVSERER